MNSMKRPWILLVAVFALIVIGLGAYLALSRVNETVIGDPDQSPQALFPSTGEDIGGERDTRFVRAYDGSQVETLDFIDNGITAADPANPGNYFLAGGSGYCDENGCASGAESDEFIITYLSEENAFSIALLKEPLRGARVSAERFLRGQLGITDAQMCSLNYYLSTDSYVNSQFSGLNLGFSFCPGATPLP